MNSGLKQILTAFYLAVLFLPDGFCANLSGYIHVNQTSDTAAKAKINAMNSARRQILYNVLSKYSDKNALDTLIQQTSSDDLTNLILSTSVSDEHISATVYSANIRMEIDNDAAKKWLVENDVQNWIPNTEYSEKFTVFIVIQNGISDWAELKRIAREGGTEIETQTMAGNQIIAKMPLNYRTKFTADIHGAGWHYTDNSGVLQVWK